MTFINRSTNPTLSINVQDKEVVSLFILPLFY